MPRPARRPGATTTTTTTITDLHALLLAAGYSDLRIIDGIPCALRRFNCTTAIVVGLDPIGCQRRYCYEHGADAQAALAAWDGRDHPPGPWIKCKGAGIDLLNPAFA